MNQSTKWLALLLVFLACAFAMVPLAKFSASSGEVYGGNLGESTWGYYTALARFDLNQGESVMYGLYANRDFILVVRDLADILGPLGPDYYEGPFLLNTTGVTAEGTFHAPYDGTFVFQYYVLYSADYAWFDLEYELKRVPLNGDLLAYVMPFVVAALFAICVIIWVAAWRWAASAPATEGLFLGFWSYLSSRPRYWVVPFAGMVLCIVILVIEPDASERTVLLSLLMELSGLMTQYGLITGLVLGAALYDRTRRVT